MLDVLVAGWASYREIRQLLFSQYQFLIPCYSKAILFRAVE